ncbi:MAG TPA: TraB/GumN family protein [Saprospiraceae bacterium]|nr:TraB/GumN family protein [Saprospiraceae bacterium]
MKIIPKILVFLMIALNLQAQQKADKYNLLWEVTGGDFKKPSYLFGSVHLNDKSLFDFPDSLLIAMQSCKVFAGELDYSTIDNLVEMEVAKTINDDSKDSEDSSDSSESPLSEYFTQEGYPTIIDLYLFNISKKLGLKSIGLEQWEDQKDIMNTLTNEEFKKFFGDSLAKQKFINLYAGGNLEEINKYLEEYNFDSLDVFEMKKRNAIQAESFIKSGIKEATFGVVGGGHLVGEDNVLSILKKKNYQIRPIKFTLQNSKIHELYSTQINEPLKEIASATLPYSFLAVDGGQNVAIDNMDMNIKIIMDRGLMFMTMGLPLQVNLQSENSDIFIQTLVNGITKDSTIAIGKPYAIKKVKDVEFRQFKIQNDQTNMRIQLAVAPNIVVVQVVLGFSKTGINTDFINKYFAGLKFKEVKQGWSMQIQEEGKFIYFSGADTPFLVNELKEHEHSARGSIVSKYKIWSEDGSEYLVRFNSNPPGITYNDEQTALTTSSAALATALNMKLVKESFEASAQYTTLNSEFTGVNLTVYTKLMIRGNQMILLFESQTKKKIKNQNFFEDFKFLPLESKPKVPFSFENAKLKMMVPNSAYYSESEESGKIIHNYSYVDSGAFTTIDLEISEIGKFEQLNLSDEAFTLENNLDSSLAGNVIDYQFTKINGVCPAYFFHRQSDGNKNIITEAGVFCNNHKFLMTAVSPNDSATIDIMDEYWKTLNFTVDPALNQLMFEKKSKTILQNLESKDRILFDEARTALDNFENFTSQDIPAMLDLLNKNLLDEAEDYNSKYQLVTILHDFEDPKIDELLFKLLITSTNMTLKYRILESLSLSSSSSVQKKLIGTLASKTIEAELIPEDIYQLYNDSLDLFIENKEQLLAIAEQGVARSQFLNLYLDLISLHGKSTPISKDSTRVEKMVKEDLKKFMAEYSLDNSLSIPMPLINFYLEFRRDADEAAILKALSNSENSFNRYRVVYNKVSNGKEVTNAELDKIYQEKYFWFFIMDELISKNKFLQLDAKYRDINISNAAIMNRYFNKEHEVDCITVDIIERVKYKDKYMLLSKCMVEDETGYYAGLVGPYDENDQIDLENEESLYFTDLQYEPNPKDLLPILMENLEK